jgi:acyl-coenzyme A thioesterase PaaI-like protein
MPEPYPNSTTPPSAVPAASGAPASSVAARASSSPPSHGARLLSTWRQLKSLPFGGTLFMMALGGSVPYSGALGARVISLEPGFVILSLKDRRAVRNHLGSIHAIALANLGELASGLAMMTALPDGVRSIVTALSVEFRKKARGTLVAESRVMLPAIEGKLDHDVHTVVHDGENDVVAVVTVRWRLSPPK